jgi:hypothetical protein
MLATAAISGSKTGQTRKIIPGISIFHSSYRQARFMLH